MWQLQAQIALDLARERVEEARKQALVNEARLQRADEARRHPGPSLPADPGSPRPPSCAPSRARSAACRTRRATPPRASTGGPRQVRRGGARCVTWPRCPGARVGSTCSGAMTPMPCGTGRSDRGAWAAPEDLGGTLASGPAVTAWAVNQMEVFAVFPDGTLWNRYWDGAAWHPWESLGGELAIGRPRPRPRGKAAASTCSRPGSTATPGIAGGTARAGSSGSSSP